MKMRSIAVLFFILLIMTSCDRRTLNWDELKERVNDSYKAESTFYGTDNEEIIEVEDNIVVHALRFEDTNDLKRYRRELDYRYSWYEKFNGVEDPDLLCYYGPVRALRCDSYIRYVNENIYDYRPSDKKDRYVFDFTLPALSQTDSKPLFTTAWYAPNALYDDALYNEDRPCSHIYGQVIISNNIIIEVFTDHDDKGSHEKVDKKIAELMK